MEGVERNTQRSRCIILVLLILMNWVQSEVQEVCIALEAIVTCQKKDDSFILCFLTLLTISTAVAKEGILVCVGLDSGGFLYFHVQVSAATGSSVRTSRKQRIGRMS